MINSQINSPIIFLIFNIHICNFKMNELNFRSLIVSKTESLCKTVRANLWKSCHVCVRDFHLCKNSTIDGHGSFVNLISAVTFVLQVLPCLLREATRRNTWNRQPPFLFFPRSQPSKRAWMNWIPWHAPLFCIPEFCIFETIQYFLSKKIYVFMSLNLCFLLSKMVFLWEKIAAFSKLSMSYYEHHVKLLQCRKVNINIWSWCTCHHLKDIINLH